MAEALAVRSALQSAILRDIQKLRIHSDNLTLIRVINGETQDKEIHGVAFDIGHLSALFASISFFHIPRAQNVRADSLAKTTLKAFISTACNGSLLS